MGFLPVLAESVVAAELSKCPSTPFASKVSAVAQSVHHALGLILCKHIYLEERTSKLNFVAGVCLQHGQEAGVVYFSPIFTCQSLSQFSQSFPYCPWRKPASIYNTFINLFQTSATEKFTFGQMELTVSTRLLKCVEIDV